MKPLILGLAIAATLSAGQGTQTFTGTITDEMCAETHAPMRMGPTDAECTTACVIAHGTRYALYDGKDVYILSDQKTPEQFAAQRVTVRGTLDPKTRWDPLESTCRHASLSIL